MCIDWVVLCHVNKIVIYYQLAIISFMLFIIFKLRLILS
jgi:hypothetical protein